MFVKKQKAKSSVALNVEALESREVMAGNVSAYVSGGTLYILGDNSDNRVEIRQSGTDTFRVRGLTHGGSATKVNGSTASATITAAGQHVVVSLSGGHDNVDVIAHTNGTRSLIKGDLRVFTGTGNDSIYMNKVHTWGNVHVDTGSGKDSTSINDAFVRLNMTIEDHEWNTGDRDYVWVYNSNIGYSTYKGNLKIDLNAGNDRVYLSNTTASYLNVKTYGGQDYISIANCKVWTHFTDLDGGPGTDTAYLRNNAGVGRGSVEIYS